MSITRDQNKNNNISKIETDADKLSIKLQMQFWSFVSDKLRVLINQRSTELDDVMNETAPNPLSSSLSVEMSGILGVIVSSGRLLLIPFQKALQFYMWRLANQEYEKNYAEDIKSLEEMNAELSEKMKLENENKEEIEQKKRRVEEKLNTLIHAHQTLRRDELVGMKKPTFTHRDVFILLFDITLLGLAIAGLVYGVSIPGIAIALAASGVSLVAGAVNYGKYLYDEVKQKENFKNHYQTIRKTLGFALAIMSVVSSALILSGVVMGAAGVPVIMAGAGLAMAMTIIAVGMMVVDVIKKYLESKHQRESRLAELEVTTENKQTLVPSSSHANDVKFHEARKDRSIEPAQQDGEIEYPDKKNPFIPKYHEKVGQYSFFRKIDGKNEFVNDVEMTELQGESQSESNRACSLK
ncbi:MAG TPA: hypothetical protein VL360_07900 [Gammaproteobacteria bacterium]|jgi:flagellar biosynthesis component FlhA|nr:hypothetical protein [Gammaproteobacteria bacterium]